MPLDPQVKLLLDQMAGLPRLEELSVADARKQVERRIAGPLPTMPVAAVLNRTIPGPGGDLPVRIYTPNGNGPFPLIVFFHGSGFVLCSLDTHDGVCRNFCSAAGCVVVSVDYRLAPEHKFPAGAEDCYAATKWAAEHAHELNANPGRMVIAGDSAGGNLVAVVALMIRDQGGPALRGQLMIYPVTDHFSSGHPSYTENAEGYGLTAAGMRWFWDHYLNSESEASNPLVSPLRARDLRDLPPALIITAEYDVLRDEGERYGARLADAGVRTKVVRYDGMNHGFFNMYGMVDKAASALEESVTWLKERLA
jgi:acetyl esterase/lipase